jgi:hypothetical protein
LYDLSIFVTRVTLGVTFFGFGVTVHVTLRRYAELR